MNIRAESRSYVIHTTFTLILVSIHMTMVLLQYYIPHKKIELGAKQPSSVLLFFISRSEKVITKIDQDAQNTMKRLLILMNKTNENWKNNCRMLQLKRIDRLKEKDDPHKKYKPFVWQPNNF